MSELTRITIDPEVMTGKPCIRGMRVTVGMIVEAIAAGRSESELLADLPYLEKEDIRQALAYARTTTAEDAECATELRAVFSYRKHHNTC